MLILGIESATASVGCAIADDSGIRAARQVTRERQHAELLAPQIQATCIQAGVAMGDLQAVAVDVGPGLYTGLRVGMASAIMIAHALGVPVVSVCSLDLLAHRLRYAGRTIVALIDARRGEVFHAQYRCVSGVVQRVRQPAVDAPDHVASQIAAELASEGNATLLTGDGARRYHSLFEGLSGADIADTVFDHPCAESLALLGHAMAKRGESGPPTRIEPIYLRRPDARLWGHS